MKVSLKFFYSPLLILILLLDIVITNSCKKVAKQCKKSSQCCDDLVCALKRCCVTLWKECEKDKDCCSRNCKNGKCKCAVINTNKELDNESIRDAVLRCNKMSILKNVHNVTDMKELFFQEETFNSDISC